jgi:hypothetical protein
VDKKNNQISYIQVYMPTLPRLRISFPQLRRKGDSKEIKNPGGNPGLDKKIRQTKTSRFLSHVGE